VGLIRGLWRIPDGKGESGLFSCLKLRGGSPHLCRLRTNRLAPVSKFDYVLTHTGLMGSCKLSSFDCHRVGRYLTSPIVIYTRIVYVPPTDSLECGIAWKMWDLAQLFDCCRKLWPLVESLSLTCVVLLGCYLARCKLIRIFVTLSDMSDTCLLQPFHRIANLNHDI
jgi:hypothetical protein